MVEFAIVAPILLAARLRNHPVRNPVQQLPDSHRRGTGRRAAGSGEPDARRPGRHARSPGQRLAATSTRTSDLDVTVDPYDPLSGSHSWAQGGDVTVTATYPYSINLLGVVVKSGRLTSQTTERVE